MDSGFRIFVGYFPGETSFQEILEQLQALYPGIDELVVGDRLDADGGLEKWACVRLRSRAEAMNAITLVNDVGTKAWPLQARLWLRRRGDNERRRSRRWLLLRRERRRRDRRQGPRALVSLAERPPAWFEQAHLYDWQLIDDDETELWEECAAR